MCYTDILSALDKLDFHQDTFKIVVFRYYIGHYSILFRKGKDYFITKYDGQTKEVIGQIKGNKLTKIFSFLENDQDLIHRVLIYERNHNSVPLLVLISRRVKGTNNYVSKEVLNNL